MAKTLSKAEAAEVHDNFPVRQLYPSEAKERGEGGWIYEPLETLPDDYPPLWSAVFATEAAAMAAAWNELCGPDDEATG